MARGATAAAWRDWRGAAWNSRGAAAKCCSAPRRDWAIRASAAAASRRAVRAGLRRCDGAGALRRSGAAHGRGADRAQIAFDHRQPIDHMAERVVNGFERILGVAVGFGLAEADVGQFALDEIDQAAVRAAARPALRGCSRPARRSSHAGFRDGAECPAARPRPGRDCRRGDRPRLPAVRADRTRAVRDGRRRRRCRCRPACGRCGRTAPAARLRAVRSFRRRPAARGFPASRSARRCAVRGSANESLLLCRRGQAGRPWTTAGARRRRAAPARRWRRHWRRWREAPRWRLRAAAPSRDRRWRAGSGRAWRRDCGSPRHSRRVARPASASAALREFRSSARSMPASAWPSMPLWRVSSMRRDSERISFSIDSIARRGIASVMAWRISASSLRKAAIDCSIPSGRCSASIWLVILNRWRSSEEKSGPRRAGAVGGGASRRRRRCDRRRAARRHLPRRGVVEFALARGDFRDREIERGRAERRRGVR